MISSLFLSSTLFLAFGIPSGPDLVFLLVIVMLVFGIKRIPEIGRSLAQGIHEFKKVKQELEEAANAKPSSSAPVAAAPAAPPTATTTAMPAPTEEIKSSLQS